MTKLKEPSADWRALLSAKAPAVADLENTIAALRDDADEAAVELERLRASRRSVLLSGSDNDLQSHDDQAGAAVRRRERCLAAIEEITPKLTEAVAQRDERARERVYAAACKVVDAARVRLKKEYPPAVKTIRSLLRELVVAEKARLEANEDLPAGAAEIASAEDFRAGLGGGLLETVRLPRMSHDEPTEYRPSMVTGPSCSPAEWQGRILAVMDSLHHVQKPTERTTRRSPVPVG